MFRYKRGVKADYNRQGYIYFTSRRYRELDEAAQQKILNLCLEHGGEYYQALFGDHGCPPHGAGHAAPHGQDHAVPEGAEVLRELPNAAVKTHAERTQEHTCVRFSFSAKLQLSDTLFVVP